MRSSSNVHDPAYYPPRTLSGLILFGLLGFALICLLVAPLPTLLAVLVLGVVAGLVRRENRRGHRATYESDAPVETIVDGD